jgi:hypothetical protein
MAYEIPQFRAAIIEASNRKSSLFHNHSKENGFIYRYPLIQYKVIHKRPAIVCLNAATDDIHYLLDKKEFNFRIKNRMMSFSIQDIHMTYINMQTWDKAFNYNILHYIPFNQERYKEYREIESEVERATYLEKQLYSHMVGILKQLGIAEPIELKCIINNILSSKYIEFKGQFHLTFNLNITTNLLLPNYIGVGKGVTVGFGIIKSIKKNPQNDDRRS